MASYLSASSTTIYGGVKTTDPFQSSINTQSIPLSKAQHFSPSIIGPLTSQLTAYQLMNGALASTPNGAAPTFTMPTAANLLAAYSFKPAVGDVYRIPVFNLGSGVCTFSPGSSTGVVGAFTAATGASTIIAGRESLLHVQWLAVSADGTTGLYQIY